MKARSENWKPIEGVHTGIPVYKKLASEIERAIRCRNEAENPNEFNRELRAENARDAMAQANWIASNLLPSGSGVDSGTSIDWDKTKPNRIVLNTDYHHMDEYGHYSGWSDHQIIVTPDLASEIAIRVTGRDRNNIKEYLAEMYQSDLTESMSLVQSADDPCEWHWCLDYPRKTRIRRERREFVSELAKRARARDLLAHAGTATSERWG